MRAESAGIGISCSFVKLGSGCVDVDSCWLKISNFSGSCDFSTLIPSEVISVFLCCCFHFVFFVNLFSLVLE